MVIFTTFLVSAFSRDDLQTRQVVFEGLLTQPFKDGGKKMEYIIVTVSNRYVLKCQDDRAVLLGRQCTVNWLILL